METIKQENLTIEDIILLFESEETETDFWE
jgi:hypothetical protein